jgi:hypothetical protein
MAHDHQKRLVRERRTVSAMVAIYCRGQHHRGRTLCDDCEALLDYALRRVDLCPFGAEKTTCADCPTHCYRPAMREQVRQIMQYAGPRMVLRHPILALRHLLDKRRPVLAPSLDRCAAEEGRSVPAE